MRPLREWAVQREQGNLRCNHGLVRFNGYHPIARANWKLEVSPEWHGSAPKPSVLFVSDVKLCSFARVFCTNYRYSRGEQGRKPGCQQERKPALPCITLTTTAILLLHRSKMMPTLDTLRGRYECF
ncbi:MAG: hypothetical protein EPN70_01235 [Paraburkholderia sp.]|uniref:hypothetical protein n=1 Tax=Paraburkholderia sp. TaxID=1926495 RepID=UPI00121DC3C5|nr:hypothetical protein [Paraburkholderia sp.]TAM08032.1 MAG: hypothetical protein EPN70_01235 [Paraburkholderia sp.]TAM30063.1 MAG: hypothetical protein EPN59_10680 [Paraburkholderia sp.]